VTNLLKLLETVNKCLDDGENIDIVFLDFTKAFDEVPDKKLIRKLECHGITGKLQAWIEAWISGQTQRTCMSGTKSSWRQATNGVPQRSVLCS